MTLINEEIMGSTRYNLFSEAVEFDNSIITAYGISAMSLSQNDCSEIHDITINYEKALSVYNSVIRNAVMPVHIKDIINDII